jgi:hypothetical protein
LVVEASGAVPPTDVLRDFKKFTARQILGEIEKGGGESRREWMLHRFAYRGHHAPGNRRYQFWQSENHPIELYSMPVIAQKIEYIHQNPVREGWVDRAEDYVYSSASNYVAGKGILEVAVVDIPLSWSGYVAGT